MRERERENGVVVSMEDWGELGSNPFAMKLTGDTGPAISSQLDLLHRVIVKTRGRERCVCLTALLGQREG